MDRATQSNQAKLDHPPLPPHAGGALEGQIYPRGRSRLPLNGPDCSGGALFRQRRPLPTGAETAFNADGRFQRKTIGQAAGPVALGIDDDYTLSA